MKTGDILLVDTEGFIASKIDEFQGNDFNHAGMFVELYGKMYVFEAIKTGVAFTLWSDYLDRAKYEDINFLILEPRYDYFADIRDIQLMHLLLPLTQKPYGFVNLLFFQAIKYITGGRLWLGRSRERSTKRFICGKLVAYIYRRLTGLFPNWHIMAPVDLFKSQHFKHRIFNV